MKTIHILSHDKKGFTLIELLVVISIIAILAGLALPVFSSAQRKGRLTDSLSNAKQIALGLKIWAQENGGAFPSTKTDGTTALATANDALEWLLQKAAVNKALYVNKTSAWCLPAAAADTTAADALTLKAKQNDWCYIPGLADDSDPRFPLIATGPKDATGKYTSGKTNKGGVWNGTDCVIALCDGSAKLFSGTDMITTTATATFPRNPLSATDSYLKDAISGWITLPLLLPNG